MFHRRKTHEVNPRSGLAWLVALGFAIVAGGISAAGACTIENIPWYCTWVLVAVSLLAVLLERSALIWVRVRRARNDHWAARGGILILLLGAVYTGAMQTVFFGTVLLAPVAADEKADAADKDLARRVTELETRRSWMPRPTGTASALRIQVASLEKDAGNRASQFREAALAAAKVLGPKRGELATAEAYEAIEAELTLVRAKQAKTAGRGMVDVKAAIWSKLPWGEGGGHGITYALIGISVVFIQLGSILVPSLAGSAELAAMRATAGPSEEAPATQTPRTQVAAAKPAAPRKPPEPPPVAAAPSPMAAAAAAMIEQRDLEAKAKRAKARAGKEDKPAPRALGLASRVS